MIQQNLANVSVDSGRLFLTDFQKKMLLKNLQSELRPEYRRRLDIMLRADEGQSQAEICNALGCSQETARYWIAIAQSGQAHMWDNHPIGRPKIINDEYLQTLKELVNNGPRHYGYSFRNWTADWLSRHLAKQLKIQCSPRHVSRLLKQLGLSTKPKKLLREESSVEAGLYSAKEGLVSAASSSLAGKSLLSEYSSSHK
jgi:putative transposase